MSRKILISTFLTFAFLLALPAAAADYVQFQDGRFLKVKSYELHDGWVQLQVQDGASMIIPLYRVEIIQGELDSRVAYRADPLSEPNAEDESVHETVAGLLPAQRRRAIQ